MPPGQASELNEFTPFDIEDHMQGTEKEHVHAKARLAIFNVLLEGSGSKIKLNEDQNQK